MSNELKNFVKSSIYLAALFLACVVVGLLNFDLRLAFLHLSEVKGGTVLLGMVGAIGVFSAHFGSDLVDWLCSIRKKKEIPNN